MCWWKVLECLYVCCYCLYKLSYVTVSKLSTFVLWVALFPSQTRHRQDNTTSSIMSMLALLPYSALGVLNDYALYKSTHSLTLTYCDLSRSAVPCGSYNQSVVTGTFQRNRHRYFSEAMDQRHNGTCWLCNNDDKDSTQHKFGLSLRHCHALKQFLQRFFVYYSLC